MPVPAALDRRRGLTLIEVLLVLAIVVVMATLVVPIARLARQSASRPQCAGGLKQIHLALHNYCEAAKPAVGGKHQ